MRRRCLLACLVPGVLLAGAHGSAWAAVAAHERVLVESPPTSASASVTATCPAGKKVVGAGGFVAQAGGVVPLQGQVLLDGIVPTSNLSGVRAEGVEDETGFAGDWRVRAVATCASPPAGLQRLAATSDTNSANKGVTVTCPTGKRVLGAGGETNGGARQVLMRAVRPDSALKAVTVLGVEDGTGFTGNWSVTAYAICASPPAGLQMVTASTVPDSTDRATTAFCPGGKRVLGAGGEIVNGGGQVAMDFLLPSHLNSFEALVNGSEDETGYSGTWSVKAIAVCANASQRVVAQSSNDSVAAKSVGSNCPGGLEVTGVGADITGGEGRVVLDEFIPFAGPGGVFATGFEDGDFSFVDSWFIRAYAICASPLPGLEIVPVTSTDDPQIAKAVTAACPPGKKLVGTGMDVGGGNGEVVPVIIRPNAPLTSVTVAARTTAFADDETPWTLSTFAICATPPPGLQLVAVASEPDSDFASVVASCPGGKNLLGAGGAIDGPQPTVMIEDVRPNPLLTNVTVAGIEDFFGTTTDWIVTAYAICATA
jgi:hypothetical protein